jgi:magnesium transporter
MDCSRWRRVPDIFVVSARDGKAARQEATDAAHARRLVDAADVSWVNVEVEAAAQAKGVVEALGFSDALAKELWRPKGPAYVDRDVELGLRAPMIRVERMAVVVEPLHVLVRSGVVLTLYRKGKATRFQQLGRYAEAMLRKIPPERSAPEKVTMLLTRLLGESNERNFDGIRAIEDEGERLSGDLVQEDVDRKRLARDIYGMKRALIRYLDALWDSLDAIHAIRHGDAELIADDEQILARVALLGDDVQRHIQLSEHMSEVLSSGLEVTQSIYNNQLQALNNRMAFIVTWLTILGTAVLVPNTLATVLSAAPPGLRIENPVAYLAVMIGSTVAATGAAWAWVRARVPLPKRLD